MPSTIKISILVAVRNEEQHILSCLQSLAALDYPTDSLEILIGNDDSSDKTYYLVEEFIKSYSHFRLVQIQPHNTLRGKANALHQLCVLANGEWLFFTDGDMQLPNSWLKTMLAKTTPTTGVVVGCTVPVPHHLWAILQTLDWAIYLGIIHIFAQFGVPMTSIGNNMAVRRTAYWQTGGYEVLPFSLTEDYRLFRAILAQNFDFQQLYHYTVLGKTQAVVSWLGLLEQRKRWTAEFKEFPFWIKASIAFQGFFGLLLCLTALFSVSMAVKLWLARLIIIIVLLSFYLYKIKLLKYVLFVFLYDFFSIIFYLHLLLFLCFSHQQQWKGRNY